MSSAYVKGRLKAARAALEARDWSTAASTASDILSFEASNANALIFKALALSNLNQLDESEALYRRALEEHPGLALAEKVRLLREVPRDPDDASSGSAEAFRG